MQSAAVLEWPYVERRAQPRAGLASISVIGLSPEGFRCLAGFARRGHRVVGVDDAPTVLEQLGLGRSGLGDDTIDAALTAAVVAGRATATASAPGAVYDTDVTFIAPPSQGSRPGLRDWLQAVRSIAIALRAKRSYHLVVLRGSLDAKAIDQRIIPEIERLSGKKAGRDFGLCWMPPFESALGLHMEVVGSDDASAFAFLSRLYQGLDVALLFVPFAEAERLAKADPAAIAV
jgi:GDP-mannose 6-dehydrogenase